MYRGDTFVRWWFSFWRWYHLVGVSRIIIVSPSLPLTPLSPCHITVVVVPKSWSSLRALYCSSPSHRFVWGWPLLWEEDFALKRIPSFPPLPPPSLAFFSSPSRLFLILFLLLRLFSLPFSIESHFMKLAWIAKNSLQSRKILYGFYIVSVILGHIQSVSVIFGHLHDTLTLYLRAYYCIGRSK